MESTLIAHDHWASHRVLDMLSHLDVLPEKVQSIFGHVIAAHVHWYARVTGTEADRPIWGAELSIHECAQLVDTYFENWKTVIAEDDLERIVTYHNSSGRSFSNSIREIIHHLCMHSQYHRGQIITLTRSLVDAPPATDLIVFLREGKASL